MEIPSSYIRARPLLLLYWPISAQFTPDLLTHFRDKTTEQTSLGRSLAWDRCVFIVGTASALFFFFTLVPLLRRGRGLGGSSAVNFMVFQKPPAFDIDNWEKLGSPGWNWNQYHEAVKRAET